MKRDLEGNVLTYEELQNIIDCQLDHLNGLEKRGLKKGCFARLKKIKDYLFTGGFKFITLCGRLKRKL